MLSTPKKKLVLFDIDGTLITAGGAGTRSLDRAFTFLFDISDAFNGISMAGKTDVQIIKEGLDRHGFTYTNGNVEKMKEMYLRFLRDEINNPLKQLKPGIKNVLDLLKQSGMSLGLLTGNLEGGAEIKLRPFKLDEYFIDGAFGSDHEDRDMLLPIAIEKFARRGLSFTYKECVVVGDTPRDVRCAKVHGACCIAVATGPYIKDDLLKTEADVVFDTLSEADKFIEILERI